MEIKIFKWIALLEGLSYILLLFIATPMKYYGGYEHATKELGMAHGVLFIAYIVMMFPVKNVKNWGFSTMVIVFLASLLPFGTFWMERKYLR